MFPRQEAVNVLEDELRPSSVADAIHLILERRKHLDFIASTGIHVPAFHSFIGRPAIYGNAPTSVAIYDVVDNVDMIMYKYRGDSHPVPANTAPEYTNQLQESLSSYHEWVIDSGRTVYMHDIGYSSENHGISVTGGIVLFDIEPRFRTSQFLRTIYEH